MEINVFSDFTDFIYSEYGKMADAFDIDNPSTSFISFNEKILLKYYKLYNKPLYRRAKRELQISEAIATMPHGRLWQLTHKRLWLRVRQRLTVESRDVANTEAQNANVPLQTQYPEIVRPQEVPRIADEQQ